MSVPMWTRVCHWFGFKRSTANVYVTATKTDGPCAVCLDDLTKGESSLRQLECQHKFHAACIAMWLKRSSLCPLCRKDSHEGPVLYAQRQNLWANIDNFLIRNEELIMSWTVGWATGSTFAASPVLIPFALARRYQRILAILALLLRAFSLVIYYPDGALLRAIKRNFISFAFGFSTGFGISTVLWRRVKKPRVTLQ